MLQKLLVPKNKTWKESLEYYNDFFKIDLSKYIDVSNEDRTYFELNEEEPFILERLNEYELQNKYKQEKSISLADLNEIEEKGKLNLPKELKDLYTEYGSFSIDEEEGFLVFNPNSAKDSSYFIDELSNYGYKDIFVKETNTLSDKEYEDLIDRFFFWGIGFRESNGGNALVYFYDREIQKYGEIVLLTDKYLKMKNYIFPHILAGEFSTYTLNELMCKQVNRLLLQILLNENYDFLTFNELEEYEKSLFIDDLDIV